MSRMMFVLVTGVAFMIGCGGSDESGEDAQGGETMQMSVTSSVFAEGGMIPRQHTCDGPDTSPPLAWSGVPEGTKSLALICDDPDAPSKTWVHWVLYNLPPTIAELPGNLEKTEDIDIGAKHGVSDFGRFGYWGPCPPGGTHRYFFKMYALDMKLELSGRVSKAQLESAMEGHILAEGQLMGKYTRQ